MVEPKTGPTLSDNSEKNTGNKVDIVDGEKPEQKIADQEGHKTRQKAVAIKDTSQTQTRPRIVAAGQGTFAEQILQIAWANNIKVREDADLVEVLSAIDVESEIPVEAFAAVAEILAYVYRANAGETPIKNNKDEREKDE